MSNRQTRKFLSQSKSTLLLATMNPDGSPVLHPVWYYFDDAKTRLYFYTEPDLKKATNIKKKRIVYFDVDDDKWPYRGVKGKGNARILTGKKESLSWGGKILSKYVRKGSPLFKSALEKMKVGGYVLIEITPDYFTSWDFGILARKSDELQNSIIF